ncbi:DUF808 domain-containing protein [Lignipirellula cremea]|uniref:Inner membrane protein YedI n=1 Tax=Lignipirellula cremea TaxID=2528010 RepID=A0A518E479_9BACT|nr:DUF808 domain-containing protein [Lignipirellula cremea]QDU98905.1 Inner membrane protein YedI [Lignipirellula cremea]
MPSGLAALLDDITAITRLAAASVDDISAAAAKASTKAAGVVIDDAAVTPQYIIGFTPNRELPIIWRIAKGSLINKLVFILPTALLLSAFLPWLITPILMLGGLYLCFEGAEKVIHKLLPHKKKPLKEKVAEVCSETHEENTVNSAVRTDFILSAEIMAISLQEVAGDYPSIWMQGGALFLVAIGITLAVYGVVGLIVKMDDVGLHMAQRDNGLVSRFGRGLVKAMPKLLMALTFVGTAAMLWVGGQIIVHGFGQHPEAWFGLHGGLSGWLVDAAICGVIGLAIGAAIVGAHHLWAHRSGNGSADTMS